MSSRAPACYENWKKTLGEAPRDTLEYPLFTDAEVVGETLFGPYQLLNPIAGPDHDAQVPAIYIRAPIGELSLPDMSETQDDSHHGGSFETELAALISLAFGMRAYAGAASRYFQAGGDPKGKPWSFVTGYGAQPVLLRGANRRTILPLLRRPVTLAENDLLTRYGDLSSPQANVVMRVARLYQDGVWIAESQPALAWLLLVSAVETAAESWTKSPESASLRFKAWKPELAKLVTNECEDFAFTAIAEAVSHLTGATSKFIKFLVEFEQGPPDARPPAFAQIKWSKSQLKATFSKVYEYRSRALHSGRPFPTPMCDPPRKYDHAYSEKPEGMATGVGTSVWRAEDTPILLSSFELIARLALQAWWRDLLANASV